MIYPLIFRIAIEGQLRESMQRLSKLQLEVQKYQTYLNEMDMPQPPHNNYQSADYLSTNSQNGSRSSQNSQNRSSGSDESLSRSASDLSQNNIKPSAPGTPLPSHGYAYGCVNEFNFLKNYQFYQESVHNLNLIVLFV